MYTETVNLGPMRVGTQLLIGFNGPAMGGHGRHDFSSPLHFLTPGCRADLQAQEEKKAAREEEAQRREGSRRLAVAAAVLADAQRVLGSVGRHDYDDDEEPLATVEQLPHHLQVALWVLPHSPRQATDVNHVLQ